jgi:hypothetical protein
MKRFGLVLLLVGCGSSPVEDIVDITPTGKADTSRSLQFRLSDDATLSKSLMAVCNEFWSCDLKLRFDYSSVWDSQPDTAQGPIYLFTVSVRHASDGTIDTFPIYGDVSGTTETIATSSSDPSESYFVDVYREEDPTWRPYFHWLDGMTALDLGLRVDTN